MYFMCFLSSEGEPQARFEVHPQRLDGPDGARLVAVEVVPEGGIEVDAHVRGELELETDAHAGGELQAFRLLVEVEVSGAVVDEEVVVHQFLAHSVQADVEVPVAGVHDVEEHVDRNADIVLLVGDVRVVEHGDGAILEFLAVIAQEGAAQVRVHDARADAPAGIEVVPETDTGGYRKAEAELGTFAGDARLGRRGREEGTGSAADLVGGPVGPGVGLDGPEDAHGHFALAVRPVLLEGEPTEGFIIGSDGILRVRIGSDGRIRTAGSRLLGRVHGHWEHLRRLGGDGDLQDLGDAALQPDGLLLDRGDVVLFRLGNSRKRGVCRLGDGLLYGWLVRKVLRRAQQHEGGCGGCNGNGGYAAPEPHGNRTLPGGPVQAGFHALPHVRRDGFLRLRHQVPYIYVKLVLFHFFSCSLIISCSLIRAR